MYITDSCCSLYNKLETAAVKWMHIITLWHVVDLKYSIMLHKMVILKPTSKLHSKGALYLWRLQPTYICNIHASLKVHIWTFKASLRSLMLKFTATVHNKHTTLKHANTTSKMSCNKAMYYWIITHTAYELLHTQSQITVATPHIYGSC